MSRDLMETILFSPLILGMIAGVITFFGMGIAAGIGSDRTKENWENAFYICLFLTDSIAVVVVIIWSILEW